MKNIGICLTLMLCFSVILIQGQTEEPVKVKEYMDVVNVEIPARVFYRGKIVDNLKKSDFKLFENNKEVAINGFTIIRKKIQTEKINIDTRQNKGHDPRYFVLVFRIIDFNQELKLGLTKVFEQVLRESDKLLAFINNRTVFFSSLVKKEKALKKIRSILTEQAEQARARLNNFIYNVQKELNNRKIMGAIDQASRVMGADTARQIELFVEKYIAIWKDYKKRYLIPNLDKYYNFAKYLEKINMEKWVINFYQIELFPKLKITGDIMNQIKDIMNTMMAADGEYVARGRMLSRLLATYERELNVADNFPSEEISRLFYKVNTTFHSIFFTTQRSMVSQDLDLGRISTDIENSLREITKRTGGELITSNNINLALKEVLGKQDVLYLLTYSPKSDKREKLRITMNNPKFRVLYDSNIRQDYITEYLEKKQSKVPILQVTDVAFKEKKLNLTITGFIRKMFKKKEMGLTEIWIQVLDRDGKSVFDQKKPVTANTGKLNLVLDFSWLKKGTYDFIINVKDLLAKTASFAYLQPDVK